MRELVGVCVALGLVAFGGGTRPAPVAVPANSAPVDCASTAAVITRVLATGREKVDRGAVTTDVAKRCSDDRWSAEARTCLIAANTGEALHDCGYRTLTQEQQDKLDRATAKLGSSGAEAAMQAMQEFSTKMCACTDQACAQAVADEMTRWSQTMARRNEPPPKMSEEDIERAAAIGEEMGRCMQTAMTAGLPLPAPLTVTGLEPDRGDAAGGTPVVIKGTSFTASGARNAKVYFGDKPATVVRFASDSELIVEAPAGKANETVDVLLVFDPGGELKIVRGFTFTKTKKKK